MARDTTQNILESTPSLEQTERRRKRQELLEKQREENRRKAEAAERRGKKMRKIVLFSLLGFLVMLFIFGKLIVQIHELQQAKDAAMKNLETLQQQIEALEVELDNVTSPEYIESQARSQLRMIYPNEVMYIVDDEQ